MNENIMKITSSSEGLPNCCEFRTRVIRNPSFCNSHIGLKCIKMWQVPQLVHQCQCLIFFLFLFLNKIIRLEYLQSRDSHERKMVPDFSFFRANLHIFTCHLRSCIYVIFTLTMLEPSIMESGQTAGTESDISLCHQYRARPACWN